MKHHEKYAKKGASRINEPVVYALFVQYCTSFIQ